MIKKMKKRFSCFFLALIFVLSFSSTFAFAFDITGPSKDVFDDLPHGSFNEHYGNHLDHSSAPYDSNITCLYTSYFENEEDKMNFYRLGSDLEDVYSFFNIDFCPAVEFRQQKDGTYVHNGDFSLYGSYFDNVSLRNQGRFVLFNRISENDPVYIYFVLYDTNVSKIVCDSGKYSLVNVDGTNEPMNFITQEVKIDYKDGFYYRSELLSFSDYSKARRSYVINSNDNYKTLNVLSNSDIYSSSGDLVFDGEESYPGEFLVTYEPDLYRRILPDLSVEQTDLKKRTTVTVDVTLSEASKNYSKSHNYYYTILPFISTSDVADGYSAALDNAVGVSSNKSYYLDKYSKYNQAYAEGHMSGAHLNSGMPDICYGNNICYSLSPDNDYHLSIDFDLSTTAVVSNTTYYFYVLACTLSNVAYCDCLPNRSMFTSFYSDVQGVGGITSFYYKDNLYLADVREFSLANAIKKTSDNNACKNGLFSELSSAPDVIRPYGSGGYISYDDLDEWNAQANEEYIGSVDLGFDLTSIDGLFNSCTIFFELLKRSFYVLPSAILMLFVSSVALLIFLRVMGR